MILLSDLSWKIAGFGVPPVARSMKSYAIWFVHIGTVVVQARVAMTFDGKEALKS
jgi:hypothetical protein